MSFPKFPRTSSLVAALLLFAGAVGAQPAPSADLDRIDALAASRGTVRVLVGVKGGFEPEGKLGATQAQEQRSRLQSVQKQLEQRVQGTSSKVHHHFRTVPFSAMEVDANGLARLKASADVQTIEEDRLAAPSLLQSTQVVNAPTAWGKGMDGSGWAVAVLDTGVDKTHAFLSGKVVAEACFSSNTAQSMSLCPGYVASTTDPGSGLPCTQAAGCDHGTHVAGIAAGRGAADGSSGVARGADLIAIQVFSFFPDQVNVLSWTSDQIKALEQVYAWRQTYKIAAVNMSLGGGTYSAICDASQTAMKAAIDNLRAAGIATVIAAGNSGYTSAISAPACISSAISVGATCDGADGSYCALGTDTIAGYSNIANFVSLLAPGSLITSSVPGGGYGAKNGTSMAAPHVAGAWAVLKKAQPDISVTDALAHLRNTGRSVNDTRTGGLVLDLKRIDLATLPGSGPSSYTLTVVRNGSGTGTVTSSPGTINCGLSCSASFAAGSVVTLTAQPTGGSSFAGWSGACSGYSFTCTVTLSQARSITATFNAVTSTTQTLTVLRQGTGGGTVTSTPAGINCGTSCSASFTTGTSVTLTATPAAGSTFAGWSGSCAGSLPTCVVSMSQARTAAASFSLSSTASPQRLTVTKQGAGTGSVTSNPAGISCGTACSATFAYGASVTLTATPASGSTFQGWSGACAGTATSCTVSMSVARNVTAAFGTATQTSSALSVTTAGSGTGTVTSAPSGISCPGTCTANFTTGSSVTLTAAPATGSVFGGWSGACTGTAATCTVSMSAARSATATFNPATGGQQPTLSVTLSSPGGKVVSAPAGIDCGSTCSASFAAGTAVTLTATPLPGKIFFGWTGACAGMGTCQVTLDGNKSVRATFVP